MPVPAAALRVVGFRRSADIWLDQRPDPGCPFLTLQTRTCSIICTKLNLSSWRSVVYYLTLCVARARGIGTGGVGEVRCSIQAARLGLSGLALRVSPRLLPT
jgi:hypothetical protein